MAGPEPQILIIDDELAIRRFLRATLRGHGYRVIEAATAQEGLARTSEQRPDLIVLDLGLPDQDGLDVTRALRQWTLTPIVVLSARDQESDKVAALDAGADDYVTKPFLASELLARIRVSLRHAAAILAAGNVPGEPEYGIGPWRVDPVGHRIIAGETEVRLTPVEFSLLAALMRNPGKLMTHRKLLEEVWGPNSAQQLHYLRVYMHQLRHKLEVDPARPRYLITEPGAGYRLRIDV